MSTKSVGWPASASPVARTPATVSPPTKPPITGRTQTRPRGWTCSPSSAAGAQQAPPGDGHEGRFAQRAGVHAAEQLLHGGIAGDSDFIDLLPRHLGLAAKLADHFIDGRGNGRVELPQAFRVGPGAKDAGEDVVAEAGLGIDPGGHGQVAAELASSSAAASVVVPMSTATARHSTRCCRARNPAAGRRPSPPCRGSPRRANAAARRATSRDRLPGDRWPFPAAQVGVVVAPGRRGNPRNAFGRPDRPGRPPCPRSGRGYWATSRQQRRLGNRARSWAPRRCIGRPAGSPSAAPRRRRLAAARRWASGRRPSPPRGTCRRCLRRRRAVQHEVGHGGRLQQRGAAEHVDRLLRRLKGDGDFRFAHQGSSGRGPGRAAGVRRTWPPWA